MGNPYHFLFTIHIFLLPTHNTSLTSSNPTHSPPLRHIPHNAFMRSALPSAVIRAGVVFNPDSFSCLIFDPVKYSHLPAYSSCVPHSQIAPNCPYNPTTVYFPHCLIKTAHKATRSLSSGNNHETLSTI